LTNERGYNIIPPTSTNKGKAGTGYETAALPINSFYTQDTGMGHKYEGYGLYIENIIEVEGKILRPRNTIGLTEKRNAWTMK